MPDRKLDVPMTTQPAEDAVKRRLTGPIVAQHVIWLCSFFSLVYGLGHVASIFGWRFPFFPIAPSAKHLFFVVPLLITSLVGLFTAGRLRKLNDRSRAASDDRQRLAQSIRERAEKNYSDASPIVTRALTPESRSA
jgi:hypothetical protein